MNTAPALHMIGLALRGGNATVGEEPVESDIRAGRVRLLLVADDAAGNTVRRADHFAQAGHCMLLRFPAGRAELGRAVGRTAAALVAITDLGLASAIVNQLAREDSSYAAQAERLALKQQRAAERRTDAYKEARAQRPARELPQPAPEEKKPKPRFRTAPGGRREQDDSPRPRHTAPRRDDRRPPREGFADRTARPSKDSRHGAKRNDPYAHSRPVHFGKGSAVKPGRKTGKRPS